MGCVIEESIIPLVIYKWTKFYIRLLCLIWKKKKAVGWETQNEFFVSRLMGLEVIAIFVKVIRHLFYRFLGGCEDVVTFPVVFTVLRVRHAHYEQGCFIKREAP